LTIKNKNQKTSTTTLAGCCKPNYTKRKLYCVAWAFKCEVHSSIITLWLSGESLMLSSNNKIVNLRLNLQETHIQTDSESHFMGWQSG
jgi:hypothetical protein